MAKTKEEKLKEGVNKFIEQMCSKEDYDRYYSHSHCWAQGGEPACGIPLETHKQCCLCDTKSEYPYHIAKAICSLCKYLMISKKGGDFQTCECGKSFIDQERFDGRWVRLGGDAKFVIQICPQKCTLEEHKDNKKYEDLG